MAAEDPAAGVEFTLVHKPSIFSKQNKRGSSPHVQNLTYRYSCVSSAYFSLYSIREAALMVKGRSMKAQRRQENVGETSGPVFIVPLPRAGPSEDRAGRTESHKDP